MDETPFGRYRLRELIGEGGMGQVYEAYDTVTDRIVALKVLPQQMAADKEFRERFRREAHAAAGLRDPHVVPIHDFGEIDGRLFLDMRLIEGTDVGAMLRASGPMPPRFAVSVIDQVGSALDAAHAEGLVHRDVKPSNMLVTPKNFVYLIDFGIARSAGDTNLTSTGIAIGTMTYMAPERFTTGQADARSDVYALACVLHECLTASRPYPGKSLEQQVAGHLNKPPPKPSALRSSVPTAFDEVVARGMAKNPNDRYDTAGELAAAAYQALRAVPGPRLPTPPPPPAEEPTIDFSETRANATRQNQPPQNQPQPTRRETSRQAPPPTRVGPPPVPPLSRPPVPSRSPAPAPKSRRWILVAAIVGILALAGAFAVWQLAASDDKAKDSTASSTPGDTADSGAAIANGPAASIATTIPVGTTPVAVVIEANLRKLYAANADDSSITVIDVDSGAVTTSIDVGKTPVGLAVDSDTQTLYVANIGDGTLSVIDASTDSVTATVDIGKAIARIAVDPGTSSLFASNPDDGTVIVVDTSTREVVDTITVGAFPWGVTSDPSSQTVYVANSRDNTVSVIDSSTRAVRATIPVTDKPARIGIDPASQTAYVTHEDANVVSVLDTSSDTVVATVAVGAFPVGVVADSDLAVVYVSNIEDNTISVIDTTSRSVVNTITAADGPSGMAVDPITHVLYAGNEYDGTVSVFEPAPS
ncbi:protein kinase [Antrihabitans sp. YC3-6]|uniref:non-specific serine/threonine protein kinase n=1 Tax=Antrihabitans stalagmiti TaxID=2799499 RepID=A0A934NLI6_9NOCA|nr:serine/threonine-protein kinase [Antrihabitans stalagmiti]MBJ8337414.1 protein kinase [Antrihabitans stalagmiti]